MVPLLMAYAFAPPRSQAAAPKLLVENVYSKLIDYIEETKIEYVYRPLSRSGKEFELDYHLPHPTALKWVDILGPRGWVPLQLVDHKEALRLEAWNLSSPTNATLITLVEPSPDAEGEGMRAGGGTDQWVRVQNWPANKSLHLRFHAVTILTKDNSEDDYSLPISFTKGVGVWVQPPEPRGAQIHVKLDYPETTVLYDVEGGGVQLLLHTPLNAMVQRGPDGRTYTAGLAVTSGDEFMSSPMDVSGISEPFVDALSWRVAWFAGIAPSSRTLNLTIAGKTFSGVPLQLADGDDLMKLWAKAQVTGTHEAQTDETFSRTCGVLNDSTAFQAVIGG